MSCVPCPSAAPMTTLIAYWLGELDAESESGIEDHLFGCAACTARLSDLAQLGEGVRRATREWNLLAVLPAPFIKRLQDAGVSVREYRLEPGGSVACTVARDDDLVVAHLRAPLRDVQRLDLVLHDLTAGSRWRLEDVAFDPAADEVVLAPSVVLLRELTVATQRVQLLAVENATEREIGTYTFNHSRYE